MAVPFRVTVEPSGTVWSGPASTAGGQLAGAPAIVTFIVLELDLPKSPVEVTVTLYVSFVGTTFSLSRSPAISKESESPPDPMRYAGFCLSRNEFCADMRPTIPGASS